MDRDRFVLLAALAFALVVLSFVILGFSRIVVSFRTAQILAAPVGLSGFALAIFLFVRATLSAIGVWSFDD